MGSGDLVKILLKTKVSRYLEWKACDRSYVYLPQEGGFFSAAKAIHSVPTTPQEGLKSSLMGMLEKPRFINFINFVVAWDEAKPADGVDPKRHTMEQIYQKFGLSTSTIDFIGHAVALECNDDYLKKACGLGLKKMKLYVESLMQIGGSPFIYPLYGLGGLPEGFSRLSAINRGTYMLHKPVDGFVYDDAGKVIGVKSGEEVAKCKMVICDPSYAEAKKSKATAQIFRAICILGAPIPDTKNKDGEPALSCQIIMPQKNFKPPRKNDVYIMMVSWAHSIAAKDKYVAIVSTVVETSNPEKEIEPALALLGPILEKFTSLSEYRVPTDDGTADQVFVTTSYDPTSHFEDASTEVMKLWKTITGEDLDLTVPPEEEEDQ
jgi:Rab GDP dissociation inhibitor